MAEKFLNWMDAVARLQARSEAFVLVTVIEVKGSAPRDGGTKMIVTADRQVESIGGGHLEYLAIQQARALLVTGSNGQRMESYPLGPKLGQCCGGQVTLLFESFVHTSTTIGLFGAGHVARALVTLLAELPVKVCWVDSREQEFPECIPLNVRKIVTDTPVDEIAALPDDALVIAMTHNHPLDFDLMLAALRRQTFPYIGVIGSQSKAKRFRMRLAHRGLPPEHITPMHCPVGLAEVPGKRPMEVAVSVAAQLIAQYQSALNTSPKPTAAPTRMDTIEGSL